MTPETRLTRGGGGSHWSATRVTPVGQSRSFRQPGCEEVHWDCQIVLLRRLLSRAFPHVQDKALIAEITPWLVEVEG